jgi:hypothetical protein
MKSEKKSERTLSSRREGLSKAAQELLSRVRASPSPEVVFGLPPDAAEAKAHSVIAPLVEDTGLPVARLNQYRWYLAELCRLMRTRSGPDLAYCMEFTLKKWLSFGLEPNSAVLLASELFDRLNPKPEPEGIQPQRHEDTKLGPEEPEQERSLPPRHQDTKGEEQTKPESEGGLPRRHETHEEASEPDTGPLESSNPGVLPTGDDERRTGNDVTTPGGGP